MKNIFRFSGIIGILLTVAFIFSGCRSQKALAKKNLPNDEQLVTVYCSGPQYQSTSEAFRAPSVGESIDQAISQKIALNNARTQLASEIKVTVKGLLDNYANQHVKNTTDELEKNFQSLSEEVVNQELTGTRTICEKVTKTSAGHYKTYVAIELASDKILNTLNNRLSQDTKLKIDYDYAKFKKEFEKEMNKNK